MKSLSELIKIWEIDKEKFAEKEIGGLQYFVKDILNCKEIFNLKQGNESTKIDKRKYEFTIETTKIGRRADFVIYINGRNIIIPVEVEKYNNIENGIEQIFQYQKDWQKKYGILTDGNEWRFYKSSQYKSFFIDDIFKNPKDFIDYWKFYIKPENYYIELFNFYEIKKSFNNKLDLNFFENRMIFFDEITQLINNFKIKMKAIGVFKDIKNDKIAVETSYAYLIQFILYKVLVDNNFKKFNLEYDKMITKIKKAIKDSDLYSIVINEIKNISEYISTNIYKPFSYEQKNINEKLIENLKQDLKIDDIAAWLDIILFINRYNFNGIKNEIFGFIYENYLKDLYEDKNKGQYFTDPAIVNFMLDEIGYNHDKIKKRISIKKISIIDPSCGAGTFLYSAVDRIISTLDKGTKEQSKYIKNLINNNIFGLDIEEFPLYLAEMNILMRMLPIIVNDHYENPINNKIKIFKTKDSISEFLDVGINSKNMEIDMFSHFEKTSLGYSSFMRDEKNIEEMLYSMHKKRGKRKRFDYVVGNPPYISYNQSCKQEIDFTKKIKDKTDTFSMNDVYGVNLNTVPGRKKPYSPKPNLYAFFIALGLALLKDNGKLSFIIPQTILIAKDLDVIRYHLSKFTSIEKIITFEGKMFIGRGLKQNKPISTSSLILIIKKQMPKQKHKIQIINYKSYNTKQEIDFNEYLNNKNIEKKEKLQSSLQKNIQNWNFIKQSELFINAYENYKKNSLSIEEYRNFDLKNYDGICIDGGLNLNKNKILKEENGKCFKIFNSKKNNYKKYSINKQNYFFYDKKNEIKFIPGGQGMKAFKNRYKIIWKTRFNNIFQFSDEKDLILNGNQSLLISSNNKTEIFWLLSILNSKINLNFLSLFSKLPNEATYIVALNSIKEFIRIPKISKKNEFIKKEIIKQEKKLLSMEDYKLKDFVEFDTMMQKFISVEIDENNLILKDKKGNEISQKIKHKTEFLGEIIKNQNKKNGVFDKKEILLNDIKFLEVIECKEQDKIKNYIDHLIFALYFDIKLEKIGIKEIKKIKELCKKNVFYKI